MEAELAPASAGLDFMIFLSPLRDGCVVFRGWRPAPEAAGGPIRGWQLLLIAGHRIIDRMSAECNVFVSKVGSRRTKFVAKTHLGNYDILIIGIVTD